MTDKVQKIREAIEKRYKYWKKKESNSHSIESEIRMSECKHLLLMLDSLQEEPVSEDLEEAADEYAPDFSNSIASKAAVDAVRAAFKAGAQWKEEQMMAKVIDAGCFGFQDAALFSFRLPADKYLVGSKVKVIVIEEG